MGAREVSAGAIVFRHGDKLYIVDGTPPAHATPQAVKAFKISKITSPQRSSAVTVD
jgi:hypothetical protein